MKFKSSDGDFIQNVDKAKEILQKRLEKVISNVNIGFDIFKIKDNLSIDDQTITNTTSNQTQVLEIVTTDETPTQTSTIVSATSNTVKHANPKTKKTNDTGMTTVEEDDVLYR